MGKNTSFLIMFGTFVFMIVAITALGVIGNGDTSLPDCSHEDNCSQPTFHDKAWYTTDNNGKEWRLTR